MQQRFARMTAQSLTGRRRSAHSALPEANPTTPAGIHIYWICEDTA
jgi:hypothetical protein